MLKELIRYTEVADAKVISTFLNAQKELPEAEALFSHVLNAQHIWISRIKGIKPLYERFQIHPKQTFSVLLSENVKSLYDLLNSDLNAIIKYTIFDGTAFENKAFDILYHVVNHSTYHRGQIATQFRLNDIHPPITDFVLLKRENQL